MPDNGDAQDDTVEADEAARLLEVGAEQVRAMVEEGLLTPLGREPVRFSRAEVLALRNLGG